MSFTDQIVRRGICPRTGARTLANPSIRVREWLGVCYPLIAGEKGFIYRLAITVAAYFPEKISQFLRVAAR